MKSKLGLGLIMAMASMSNTYYDGGFGTRIDTSLDPMSKMKSTKEISHLYKEYNPSKKKRNKNKR